MRGSEYSRFHGYTYDGIWAAALAIEYVASKRNNALDKFDYRNDTWEDVFLEALRNTSFEGVTVSIHLNVISTKKTQLNLKCCRGQFASITTKEKQTS